MKKFFDKPAIRVTYYDKEICTSLSGGTDGIAIETKALRDKKITNVQQAELSIFRFND